MNPRTGYAAQPAGARRSGPVHPTSSSLCTEPGPVDEHDARRVVGAARRRAVGRRAGACALTQVPRVVSASCGDVEPGQVAGDDRRHARRARRARRGSPRCPGGSGP